MAAEIAGPPAAGGPPAGFNEAAANGRGNAAAPRLAAVRGRASMRPRRMAAEMLSTGRPAATPAAGFNEAAANGRGNYLFMWVDKWHLMLQ